MSCSTGDYGMLAFPRMVSVPTEDDPVPLSNVVYSYSRFSSASQADGDTIRRQVAMREDWLRRHPEMKLDSTLSLVDAGVSGHRGKNRKKEGNALARFADAVER